MSISRAWPATMPGTTARYITDAIGGRVADRLHLTRPNRKLQIYKVDAPTVSLNLLCQHTWSAISFHLKENDSLFVRAPIPDEVRSAMRRVEFALPNSVTRMNLASYLNWGEIDCRENLSPGLAVPRSNAPFINLTRDNRAKMVNSFQVACNIAYYVAKMTFLDDANFRDLPFVQELARLYALSIQHRVALALVDEGFEINKPGEEPQKATLGNPDVQAWFDGNDLMFQGHFEYNEALGLFKGGRSDFDRFQAAVQKIFEVRGKPTERALNSPVDVIIKSAS